jgi:hypothetical protein
MFELQNFHNSVCTFSAANVRQTQHNQRKINNKKELITRKGQNPSRLRIKPLFRVNKDLKLEIKPDT